MKKIIIFLISLIIFISIILFALVDKFNINKIIENIENDTKINIKLQQNQQWLYYPHIEYKNKLSINSKNGNITADEGVIIISRNYKINSPFLINYETPSIFYKGINFRNSQIETEYYNKILKLKKISANLIDGSINMNGFFNLDNNKIKLNGSYDNISINRMLKQLKITSWERVKIKISSPNFSIDTINNEKNEFIENLNGVMNIKGSIFFVSKEEERFGAAFLSLLAEKFLKIKPLSKSISYLLEKFSDTPSDISGLININNGIFETKNMLIKNLKEKALLSGILDLNSKHVNANIDLYENNTIFLTAKIKGDLENPNILIDSESFSNQYNSEPQNIKEIFEKGIQNLIDDILNLDD